MRHHEEALSADNRKTQASMMAGMSLLSLLAPNLQKDGRLLQQLHNSFKKYTELQQIFVRIACVHQTTAANAANAATPSAL
jgi:hypothetical protein